MEPEPVEDVVLGVDGEVEELVVPPPGTAPAVVAVEDPLAVPLAGSLGDAVSVEAPGTTSAVEEESPVPGEPAVGPVGGGSVDGSALPGVETGRGVGGFTRLCVTTGGGAGAGDVASARTTAAFRTAGAGCAVGAIEKPTDAAGAGGLALGGRRATAARAWW